MIDNFEKPREKLKKYGQKYLTNEELLAILLDTGTKNKSVFELSKEILGLFSPRDLLELTLEEITQVKGIGLAKGCKIIASIQFGKNLVNKVNEETYYRINTSSDAYNYVKSIYEMSEKENFSVIFLNTKNEVIEHKLFSIGNLNRLSVNTKEVFRWAIKRNSQSIILIHNHPSGDPKPSQSDINTTDRFIKSGEILDIYILDHIIIGRDSFFSFKDENLI